MTLCSVKAFFPAPADELRAEMKNFVRLLSLACFYFSGICMRILALFAIVLALVSMGCTQPQETNGPPGPAPPQDCSGTPGAIWCDSKQKCLLPQEENCTLLVGNDSDVHGCRISAGYSWCNPKQKCLRPWEEACMGDTPPMTDADALRIAIASPECSDLGQLIGMPTYNNNSQTWWIDLKPNVPKAGCNPACVVPIHGTPEINWRCTGAIPPQ